MLDRIFWVEDIPPEISSWSCCRGKRKIIRFLNLPELQFVLSTKGKKTPKFFWVENEMFDGVR